VGDKEKEEAKIGWQTGLYRRLDEIKELIQQIKPVQGSVDLNPLLEKLNVLEEIIKSSKQEEQTMTIEQIAEHLTTCPECSVKFVRLWEEHQKKLAEEAKKKLEEELKKNETKLAEAEKNVGGEKISREEKTGGWFSVFE